MKPDPPARPLSPPRVTLSDVARVAGVHPSTASSVLSDKTAERRISHDVAARIRRVAEELGYVPNLLAHSLQRGRTNVISFFNGFRTRQRRDFFADGLFTAVERSCGRRGYDLLMHCDFNRTSEQIYRTINGGRSDGLIFFAPRINDPLLPLLRRSSLPVVVLSDPYPEGAFSTVRDDREAGMRCVADRILKLGHTKVGTLGLPAAVNTDSEWRVNRLRTLLAGAGIEIPDKWRLTFKDETPEETRSVFGAFLDRGDLPTALFCWHDRLGYRVLEMCEERGIPVPERLSMIGYDGLHWPALTRHALASVAVDLDLVGGRAVEILDRLVTGGDTAPIHETLPVTFDPGTTLAPPPG